MRKFPLILSFVWMALCAAFTWRKVVFLGEGDFWGTFYVTLAGILPLVAVLLGTVVMEALSPRRS